MNGDVTLRDLASPDFVGVSESDTLAETVRLLAEENADSAVVLRGSEPVGSVTPRVVFEAIREGRDLSATEVGSVMDAAMTVLGPEQRPSAAAGALSNGAAHVVVSDGDETLGTVAARDVVAAAPDLGPTAEPREVVGTTPGATAREEAEAGEPPTQGICEECGDIARGLAAVDGSLLCRECRGV